MKQKATIGFGPLLRKLRKQLGVTMGDVAKVIDVSVPYVSDVERERRRPFSRMKIEKIARAFEMNLEQLLEAAAATTGTFELDADAVSSKGREAGAALMRGWNDLSEDAFDEILDLLRHERTRRK